MTAANYCSVQLIKDGFELNAEFEIPQKGVLGIFGHSGSGKTTLLRCLAGLEDKASGRIIFNDCEWLNDKKSLSSQQRNIAYVFQDSRLFPHLTVLKNLQYGVKRSASELQYNWDSLLQLLNIENLLERKPETLSGGEKQRVAIARSLLKNPQLLLMDEPMASLDAAHKNEIIPYLETLHETLNIPLVYVSHSLQEVSRFCDRVLVLESGKVIYSDTVSKALSSADSPLLKTQNAVAVFDAVVSELDAEFCLSSLITDNGTVLQVKGLHEAGRKLRLRINAADVSLSKSRVVDSSILNILLAKVVAVVDETDSEVLLQLSVNEDIFLSRISKKSFSLLNLTIDSDIFIQIKGVVLQSLLD
ncbi:MAG: molybdenum ABC transporter ATP-binding protein [Gammaproteobacteria bacterium]|nr:molybdenum ABC transporter ATP-binding protein [Gammaproteobacteria bacterium]